MAKHVNSRGEIVDDLVFNEQQRRKKQPKPKPAPMIPEASCCGTCESWSKSNDPKDVYGTCQFVMVADHRAFTLAEAETRMVNGPAMRCASSFVCSHYRGEYELLPIAHANVDFKTESTAMRDLIRAERPEWEWPE